MMRPTSVDPVNATLSMPGCSMSAWPVFASQVRTLSTPGGKPTSMASSANASAVSGVYFAGLMTTVLPAASAGATFHANISSGKFHGMIWPTTPHACVVGKLGFKKLRPTGVVIEMARDEGNIDVAALADGLAVVHGFENGETAGMFLHLARESIEIAGALVAAERLPGGQRLARGGDGGVHVGDVALGDFGKDFAGGGIAGGLVLAARGRDPRAADELVEAAVMAVEPLLTSLGSSGAAPYSMV